MSQKRTESEQTREVQTNESNEKPDEETKTVIRRLEAAWGHGGITAAPTSRRVDEEPFPVNRLK